MSLQNRTSYTTIFAGMKTRLLSCFALIITMSASTPAAMNVSDANYKSVPQALSFSDIIDIVDLYQEDQYEIIKAKLGNAGYIIDKSTPDYTLRGEEHYGQFSMVYETDHPSKSLRGIGATQSNDWTFSTNKNDNRKTINISYDISTREASYLYKQFISIYEKSDLTEYRPLCNTNEQCRTFGGPIQAKIKGFKSYCFLEYRLYESSIEETDGTSTKISSIRANFTFNNEKMLVKSSTKK
jgi:hypothetical protein